MVAERGWSVWRVTSPNAAPVDSFATILFFKMSTNLSIAKTIVEPLPGWKFVPKTPERERKRTKRGSFERNGGIYVLFDEQKFLLKIVFVNVLKTTFVFKKGEIFAFIKINSSISEFQPI